MKYRYFLFLLGCFFSFQVLAQSLSIIRDAEIETKLESYMKQAFKVAHLDENKAKVVLIQDDSINAFVAGGYTIFVHTGLITHASAPDDVMFVLSHETGHIKGGHAIRGMEKYKQAQTTSLVSSLLGGALAVALGRPDAGLALMIGGQQTAANNFLSYRQTEESAADRIAVDIMNQTNYSLKGFTNIMSEIKRQERLQPERKTGYLSSHPLTQNRQADLRRFVDSSQSVKQEDAFDMMKAKLFAFLYEPKYTFNVYKGTSDADLYAQAIAFYKSHQLPKAVEKIDILISKQPNNPYLYELKGQFYFESGQIKKAIPMYQKAVELLPENALLRISLAQTLLEQEEVSHSKEVIRHLSFAVLKEPEIPLAWQLLATAYYRANEPFKADYAMAEYYFITRQSQRAEQMAERVIKNMPASSSQVKKAKEILYQIQHKN